MFARLKILSVFAFLLAGFLSADAQMVIDVSYGQLKFLNANRIAKVGTDGSAAGNVTLYTNVITVNGQQVDCIVRTVTVTGGSFGLPGGAPGGTIPFDYSSASGTGMSANQDSYFSPTLNFNSGGGYVKFRFEFILGGSYNNSTNTGTPVILKNIYLNTYDIDGNGGSNSNQYNEFGSFSAYTLATTGSNIGLTYNTSSGLTKFRSNTTANTTNVTADANRARVKYDYLSVMDIQVGAEGSGAAYFFLDFSGGVNWTNTPTDYNTPALDLDTTTPGIDNSETACGNGVNLTKGGINYTGSSGFVNEMTLSFSSATILDGNQETLYPSGSSSPTNDIFLLGFTGSATQNFVLGGVNFTVQFSVASGTSTMLFTKNGGGTFTTAQAETLLDALVYKNTKTNPTAGTRTFTVVLREAPLTSPAANFNVTLNCSSNAVLPVSLEGFTADVTDLGVMLRWATITESNNKGFRVERSSDGTNFHEIGYLPSKALNGSSSVRIEYNMHDQQRSPGKRYYRLVQEDHNGQRWYSKTLVVNFGSFTGAMVKLYPNPSTGNLTIQVNSPASMSATCIAFDQKGGISMQRRFILATGYNELRLDMVSIPAGIYHLKLTDSNGTVILSERVIRL